MQEFLITWTVEIEAETPLEAVREALRCQRDAYNMENLFGVGYYKDNRWHDEEIDLGYDNPFGRPPAVIEGDEVCCGHCGSRNTRYLEDVGQRSFMWADNGTAYASKDSVTADFDGADPRVWCAECGGESELPNPFELVGSAIPHDTRRKEVPHGRAIHGHLDR
ncbi:MAG TPA: hypothetical protein VLB76_26750 [Thermoanaerobaculia bacterium]|jgi:hypothetical protein|nr:hypothetical protein [Thermoanaerobaculia bacterium]